MSSQVAPSVELSLIIPTYNERVNIIPLVESIHRALPNCIYELIVVDDDSPDGTAEVAESLAQKFPIKVVRRKQERGLATAVVEGFGHALGKVLGVIDADLQHPPEIIPELLRKVWEGADIAIATRYIEGGGTEGWSLWRRITSRTATWLTRLVLPAARRIRDPLSGFFLLKREVIEGIKLTPTGYKILLEVLAKGRIDEVAFVPYVFRGREAGSSKFSLREQIDYLRHLYTLSRMDRELRRLLKFLLVGCSGIFVNLGMSALLTGVAGLDPRISVFLAIETSILTNFTLHELWTFSDRAKGKRSAKLLLSRIFKFHVVSGVGLGINYGVFYFLYWLGLYYLLANLIGIFISMSVRFVGNTLWTWRAK